MSEEAPTVDPPATEVLSEEDEAEAGAGEAAATEAGKRRKRKGRRRKKAGAGAGAVPTLPLSDSHNALVAKLTEESAKAYAAAKSGNVDSKFAASLKRGVEDPSKPRRFWDTQPVPKLTESVTPTEIGPLEPDKPVEEVRAAPYNLPKGYEWSTIDIRDPVQRNETFLLLRDNYVEDDDSLFRFAYAEDFLEWALTPPGFFPDWMVGVRVAATGKLYAFISGVPCHIHVHDFKKVMCEINFLCVHKKLREKRLAPVLIKEVTRRVNLCGIFQAVYTAGIVIPTPVSAARYWHRNLQPKKLIEVNFTRLQPRMTMARTLRLYRLDDTPRTPGFQPLTAAHVPQAHRLLNAYLSRFALHPEWSLEEFAHWMLPRDGVVDSFVVVDDDGTVTDLCSYYWLPSSVLGHAKHDTLNAVYSFYNVPGEHSLTEILGDCLIAAKAAGADVFNMLDLAENATVLDDLKFGQGDGLLHYYCYNMKLPPMTNGQVGLVLQ